MDEKQIMEQILKAIINWNGQKIEFDKKFLKYQENFDLIIEEEDNTIVLITKIKEK